jgi:hypothetical protein
LLIQVLYQLSSHLLKRVKRVTIYSEDKARRRPIINCLVMYQLSSQLSSHLLQRIRRKIKTSQNKPRNNIHHFA